MCVVAATTAFAGIVVATQPSLTLMNSVIAAASYNLLVGLEVVFTALYLYRQIDALAEAESLPAVSRREPASLYVSRVLVDEESLLS